ncbi:hypothetical protein SAMN04488515_1952 [Cognatiyoonia koreensis]|uniref:Uncharacterized protein n=1 Tax=Cognatiyoonia koreensis TaxID=364200 RepID=A0A1I0QIK5_9RHOB|nr:hypothetical protein [Cognatiyoonia koreensis]SEW27031.1 hypothetical protein SAMN04488515_1952 [Cognatiyoonia koreensis]
MRAPIVTVGVLLLLAACGGAPTSNPMPIAEEPDVPRLSDLDVAADAPNVSLAAGQEPVVGPLISELISSNDGVAAGTSQENSGFFGRIFSVSAGSSASGSSSAPANSVPPNAGLAFGEIAPTCGMSRRDLGTEVASASGYTIYDTIPNSTAPRTHYITGFDDNCARQFTAALVLLGDVGTHEVVRYNPANRNQSYTATDNAYEAIKASFCRAGFGKPCGGRIDRLAKRTTFVTAYERFGSSPVWANFLLHNGDVAASDIEGR